MGLLNIEDWIKAYAKHKRISAEGYPEFREGILKGLTMMKLRTDVVEERKFIQIANLKSTKEVLQCRKEYNPMDMFE
jgi:hypothetical protein